MEELENVRSAVMEKFDYGGGVTIDVHFNMRPDYEYVQHSRRSVDGSWIILARPTTIPTSPTSITSIGNLIRVTHIE